MHPSKSPSHSADPDRGVSQSSVPLHPTDQQFSFVKYFFGQPFVQIEKEFFVPDDF